MLTGVAELRRRMQRPEWIDKMRPSERAEVCSSCGDDPVHLVRFGDVAHRDRWNTCFVADLIAERGLIHTAVHRVRIDGGLPGRDMNDVGPCGHECACDLDGVVARDPCGNP